MLPVKDYNSIYCMNVILLSFFPILRMKWNKKRGIQIVVLFFVTEPEKIKGKKGGGVKINYGGNSPFFPLCAATGMYITGPNIRMSDGHQFFISGPVIVIIIKHFRTQILFITFWNN